MKQAQAYGSPRQSTFQRQLVHMYPRTSKPLTKLVFHPPAVPTHSPPSAPVDHIKWLSYQRHGGLAPGTSPATFEPFGTSVPLENRISKAEGTEGRTEGRIPMGIKEIGPYWHWTQLCSANAQNHPPSRPPSRTQLSAEPGTIATCIKPVDRVPDHSPYPMHRTRAAIPDPNNVTYHYMKLSPITCPLSPPPTQRNDEAGLHPALPYLHLAILFLDPLRRCLMHVRMRECEGG